MRGSGWQGLCFFAALAVVLVWYPLKEVMGCCPPAQVPPGDAGKEGTPSSASPCCHSRTLPSVFPGCSSSVPFLCLPLHLPFHLNCCLQLLSGDAGWFSSSFGVPLSPAFPPFNSTPSSLPLRCFPSLVTPQCMPCWAGTALGSLGKG